MKKKDTKTDWLKKHHEADSAIYSASCSLQRLSNAFYDVGNDVVGNRLADYADIIELARKDMVDAVGESISESLHTAQEHSATILKSCLTGMAITGGKR